MTPAEHDDDLAYEQSVNERYLRQAKGHDGPDPLVAAQSVTTPSARMTNTAPTAPKVGGPIGPLIGRVALNPHDEDLGQTFYVGHRYIELDEATTVLSWGAGAARLFFEGRSATVVSTEMVQPQTVTARRSFQSSVDRLVDFEDDLEKTAPGREPDPDVPFPKAAPLEIPLPPTRPSRAAPRPRSRPDQPDPHKTVSQPPSVDSRRTARKAASRPEGTEVPRETASTQSAGTNEAEDRRRANRLLDEAIAAPKTGALASVLATLQSEQYRLVTWPKDRDLLVQGHPGTGKTIVAAHRAAYLVLPRDPDDEGPRLHKVAMVGPTDRWKRHIHPTVSSLVDEGVEVLSLEELVRGWARLSRGLHPTSELELHSRWAIGRMADRAARSQHSRLRRSKPAARIRELVNSLVQDTAAHRRFARHEDTDLSAWLLEAGDYEQARRDPSYLLFLAAAGIVAGSAGPHNGYQHIVVDEVQDIRPVEWWMLSRMFRKGTKERWSLFGDMNQRRSDSTWESWETAIGQLELSGADGQSPVPELLDSGYRSTREILEYAGALLPRGMRRHDALRNGPEPSIRRVGPNQLADKSIEAAERLSIRHHQGSVAVIAWGRSIVEPIEQGLRRRGWRKDTGGGRWLQRPLRNCRLSVILPVEARGLEFDAVVVVEPADFKPNLGRHGELYTSLTRANQELVVVHSKAMQRELRGRGNRAG